MMIDINAALEEFEGDKKVGVVVLTGGEKIFSGELAFFRIVLDLTWINLKVQIYYHLVLSTNTSIYEKVELTSKIWAMIHSKKCCRKLTSMRQSGIQFSLGAFQLSQLSMATA